MKKTALILLTVFIMIGIVYLKPVHHATFRDYYPNPDAVEASLEKFRTIPLHSLQISGTTWHYLVTGQGSRQLLLLHGMGGAYDIWWQQIEDLQQDFRIISLTLPDVHHLNDAMQGILAILDAEGFSKTSVLGTSMGGYLAQYLLSRHPERIDRLILGNTFAPNDFYQKQYAGLRKWLPFVPAWLIMDKFRKNLHEGVLPAAHNDPVVEAYLKEQYSGLMSKKQFIGRVDLVLEHFEPVSTEVQRSVPKLIIEADNDPLVNPQLQEGLRERYPEASVVRLHDVGHFPYLNEPRPYTRIIRQYLER